MAQGGFLDTAIPIILLIIVVGFLWSKLGKHIIKLVEWLREMFKSKKNKDEPRTYSYVEYD